jgi:hypothetical protein
MNLGKTIQIYLPDGNPKSIKIAEITSRTVMVIQIPRSKLDFAFSRTELNNVGLYFLIGGKEEEIKQPIYIGEAEDVAKRLKQHNKQKEFWNTAVVVISKTQYFTKTHIKFLEYYCHSEAEKAGRYKTENSNIPQKPFISEAMESDLMDNFDTIQMLVSTLGFPVFDSIKKPEKAEILVCKGKDAFAEGVYTEDGFVIFKGSKCNVIETKSSHKYLIDIRKKLVDEEILVENGNILEFKSDYVASSPSTAAAIVLARNANGWKLWKYKDGKTLDEVKRQ